MTDAQLSLLLLSLLDDLENTLQEVRDLLPEDAEQEEVKRLLGRDEYGNGLFTVVAGDYTVLQPLLSYIDKWRERVKVLSGETNE